MNSLIRAMQLEQSQAAKLTQAKVLVVGAGGIGCEVLKDLVLTGFSTIDVIDLDTIDVSNLNRQFFFRREHVGKSKAQIACSAIRLLNPQAKITAHHGNVKAPEFGPTFFANFDIVINALDNLVISDARRHVNRLCVSLKKPLIESATEGYMGQVAAIVPGVTECFECNPKEAPKTFAVCTIRSNPTEPIHCIHWAKMLFGQLWGEKDDTNTITSLPVCATSKPRDIALSVFDTVFNRDVAALAAIEKMWTTRKPPTPITFILAEHSSGSSVSSSNQDLLPDQQIWDLAKNSKIFIDSFVAICEKAGKQPEKLIWDKDDNDALDFVTSAANIRAQAYGIPCQSRFDVKAKAGNIIPAVATSNAVIAGLVVLEAAKVLAGQVDKCRTIFLQKLTTNKRLLTTDLLGTPKPTCFVCGHQYVEVMINTSTTTLGTFVKKVLHEILSFNQPSIIRGSSLLYETGDGLEDDELAHYELQSQKKLKDFELFDQTQLTIEDQSQEFRLTLQLVHTEFTDGKLVEIKGADLAAAHKQFERDKEREKELAAAEAAKRAAENDSDAIQEIVVPPEQPSRKRKHADTRITDQCDTVTEPAQKRVKQN